ncbi:DUF4279 domain-containing protein [Vandammella animalimorsus]|uniref:DUF4279 domain-containing protein n=1 Tax=Vandammella animalimorsus TaxID=2029117 RepID=UPI00325AD2D8
MHQIQCYSYFCITSQTQTLHTGTDRLSHVAVENGNFDPAAITALLGIQPHRAWRQGDRNPLGKPYRTSNWSACLQQEPVFDAGLQCQRIALQLHDKIHALNALRQQYAVQFWITVVPTMYPEASTPALSLGREVIEFCYLTGTQIDVDMYVYEATS